ncbi:MAG: hypothetical protein SFU98_08355 [Leptospiraceae bacterium]|nr:hypothetical protein [Leptospiraceae bacterium]
MKNLLNSLESFLVDRHNLSLKKGLVSILVLISLYVSINLFFSYREFKVIEDLNRKMEIQYLSGSISFFAYSMNIFPWTVFWGTGFLIIFLVYEISFGFFISTLITTTKIPLTQIASAHIFSFRKFILCLFPLLFYRELFKESDSYFVQITYTVLCLGTFFYGIYKYGNEFIEILKEHCSESSKRSFVHWSLPILVLSFYFYTILK